jgi:hypothetical protein
MQRHRKLRFGWLFLAAFLLMVSALGFAEVGDAESAAVTTNDENTSNLPDAPSVVRSAEELSPSGSFSAEPAQYQLQFQGLYPALEEGSRLLTNARFLAFERRACSLDLLAGTFFDALQALHKTAWSEYGGGLQGFEKRYGAMLADRDASSFFGTFLFPTLFHQNPRYSRLGPRTSLWRRAVYAVSRTAIAQNDAGGAAPNLSLLLTIVAAQSLKNLYYPEPQRGFAQTLQRSQDALLGNMQDNLSREFVPDIERFLWKRMPDGLKRLEQRLPFRRLWEPPAFAEDLPTTK